MQHAYEFHKVLNPARRGNAVARFHSDRLVRLAQSGEVLTKRRRVELFLKALDEGELAGDEWVSLQTGVVANAKHAQPMKLDPQIIALYKGVLSEFVATPHTMPRVNMTFGQTLCTRLEYSVVNVPRFNMTADGALVIEDILMGADDMAGLDFAMALILDANGEFAKDLCRCKHCGKLFLVIHLPKGRPSREFCPLTTHRDDFFGGAAATERARQSRQRRAERKRVKRPRKTK